MMSVIATARRARNFDRFLHASLGDDNNGMPLTVLSALARLDSDPWDEASRLMQLQQAIAVTQLALQLGTLRDSLVAGHDPASIAAPLIALLPRSGNKVPLLLKAFTRRASTAHHKAVSTTLAVLTYFIVMLLSQWLFGGSLGVRQKQLHLTIKLSMSKEGLTGTVEYRVESLVGRRLDLATPSREPGPHSDVLHLDGVVAALRSDEPCKGWRKAIAASLLA
jgi:hypothetical protein